MMLIQGGRVIDPKTGTDAVLDVAVENGKIVEVKVQQMPETPSSEAGIQNAIATGTAPAVSENIN